MKDTAHIFHENHSILRVGTEIGTKEALIELNQNLSSCLLSSGIIYALTGRLGIRKLFLGISAPHIVHRLQTLNPFHPHNTGGALQTATTYVVLHSAFSL
jgi:hypothetical protein